MVAKESREDIEDALKTAFLKLTLELNKLNNNQGEQKERVIEINNKMKSQLSALTNSINDNFMKLLKFPGDPNREFCRDNQKLFTNLIETYNEIDFLEHWTRASLQLNSSSFITAINDNVKSLYYISVDDDQNSNDDKKAPRDELDIRFQGLSHNNKTLFNNLILNLTIYGSKNNNAENTLKSISQDYNQFKANLTQNKTDIDFNNYFLHELHHTLMENKKLSLYTQNVINSSKDSMQPELLKGKEPLVELYRGPLMTEDYIERLKGVHLINYRAWHQK